MLMAYLCLLLSMGMLLTAFIWVGLITDNAMGTLYAGSSKHGNIFLAKLGRKKVAAYLALTERFFSDLDTVQVTYHLVSFVKGCT